MNLDDPVWSDEGISISLRFASHEPVSRYAEMFLNVPIFSSTLYSTISGPRFGDFLDSEVNT